MDLYALDNVHRCEIPLLTSPFYFSHSQLDQFTTTYVLRQLQVYTETKIEIYGLTSVGRGIPSKPAYVGE